jgi:hypothetical protein
LTIVLKEGATLDMPILDDKGLTGLYENTDLTLNGPASFTTTLMTDGTISLTNVATANITGYRGDIEIETGVVTFTGTDVTEISVAATADDLKTFTAKMKRDDEPTLSTAQTAALEYDAAGGNLGDIGLGGGLANLETVNISGKAGDITISSAPNLTSVVISADSFDLTMDDNDNLTSVNVTGAKFHDVAITDMADLASLTLNHTTKLPEVDTTAANDEKGASLNVSTNASLASLTVSADDIDNLTVTTNASLETVDFTGLTDDGSATSTAVAIYNNSLDVQLVKDAYNDTTQNSAYVQYTATDTGSVTSDSGIGTLKTYLDNVVAAASATAGVYVFVDQIDKYEVQSNSINDPYTDTAVPAAPSVTTEATANSNKTSIYAIVAVQGAESAADTGYARSETLTQVFPVTNNSANQRNSQLSTNEGFAINVAGLSKSFMVGDNYSSAANGSTVQTVADLVSYINADTSWSGLNIDITVTDNSSYLRSMQEVQYYDGAGAAKTISTGGTLWYKLGSTTASGQVTVATGGGASNIANKVAAAIEAHTYNGASLYNATANGAVMTITKAVSVTGYADDVTSAASVPAVSFVIDAAGTSTGATLGGNSAAPAAASNTAVQGLAAASGFSLAVAKTDISGVTFKIVNSNSNIARLAGDRVLHLDGATSPTIGYFAGTSSQTSTADGPSLDTTSATLVSGTHFLVTAAGGVNSYATTFAQISSVTAGAVTQTAAVTDRTGWLSS